MNLRDTLLGALAKLPGTRDFHLHVLVSSPRKYSTLYPFAIPRPKTFVQDILILLSSQATPSSPRVMVTGIEANLYNVPSTSSAILYISKVDSTGQATSPSPTTALVRALLGFYANRATCPIAVDHFWIQLFARAQGQYLFPNSTDYAGKRPLSDTQLCTWWKRVFTDVAAHVAEQTPSAKVQLYYILPGYSEAESIHLLKQPASSAIPTGPQWTYGHPYSQTEIPLPCSPNSKNLGHYIPYFNDDPKSRFLDEIAFTTEADGVKSPVKKRARTSSGATNTAVEKETKKDERPNGELSVVSADDFWERMSFRQECVAGAVTGFFTIAISSPETRAVTAPQPGQVSSQINKRILVSLQTAVEFSTVERANRATETLETSIKGLCEGLSVKTTTPEPSLTLESTEAPSTPPRQGNVALPEVSPNPFPESAETSLETYYSHIYGSIHVSNPIASIGLSSNTTPAAAPVTVLAVRRKKRPQPF